MIRPKYKKLVKDDDDNCIYCRERHYDCFCEETTAKSLGFKPIWVNNVFFGWKKDNMIFKKGGYIADYHNAMNTIGNKL